MQRVVVGVEQIEGTTLSLTVEQQHYLIRVLRLQPGDRFLVLNGQGSLWLATLNQTGEKASLSASAKESAQETVSFSVKPRITLAACLPKQGFDEVVRQVTELGVSEIVPVISDRTLLRPSLNKLQRWRRISAEAAEQSERLVVPKIYDPISLVKWLNERADTCRYLCTARYTKRHLLSVCLSANTKDIVVAVGPEGGWTGSEIEKAIAVGYQSVTLGTGVLRAVTAAVAAVSVLRSGFEFASIEPHLHTQT